MKICTQCKEEKSDADFIKTGMYRHPMCDPCRKNYLKKYNFKLKNIKQKNKLW